MEGPRSRSRYRGSYSGPRAMSMSPAARYENIFGGAVAAGRASYRAMRTGVVARRARAMLDRRTAGFLGIERKFYDTSLSATTIAAATDATGGEYDPSATSMISTPAQGDAEQNRDGKKIMIDAVQVKGIVDLQPGTNLTALTASTTVYLALVLDTQSNAAQMNSEDCFKNTVATAGGAAEPMRNLLFGSRFRVLKSEQFVLNHTNATWDGTNIEAGGDRRIFDWYVPFKGGLPVNFNAGTTASIANVVDNSLHLIAFASAATLLLTYNARIRFRG